MTDGLLLDTHTWLWFTSESTQLSRAVIAQIRAAANADKLFVAAYSLFEISYAVQRKRIALNLPLEVWLESALAEPIIRLLPLTPAIAHATTTLPQDFRGDPGDRLIAATAITHNLVLCTHDDQLLRFSKLGLFKALKA